VAVTIAHDSIICLHVSGSIGVAEEVDGASSLSSGTSGDDERGGGGKEGIVTRVLLTVGSMLQKVTTACTCLQGTPAKVELGQVHV
jgi:hypothetical protein